jgi:hypothetical protein
MNPGYGRPQSHDDCRDACLSKQRRFSIIAADVNTLAARDGLAYVNRTWHRIGSHSVIP